MTDDREPFERLREARQRAGFKSARSAAIRFGWAPSTYAADENGSRQISTDDARRYGRAFKTNPAWLLLGTGPEQETRHDAPAHRPSRGRGVKTLEERIAALEEARLRQIGRINALESLLISLWFEYAQRTSNKSASAFLQLARKRFLEAAEKPDRMFPGVDPVFLDAANQEYREALADIFARLEKLADQSSPSRKP